MKLFLQELKNLALILQELARKNCKIIFLQDIIKILQEKFLQVLARSVQDFSILARKSFIFSARFARFNARLAYFLQDDFYWVAMLYVYTCILSPRENSQNIDLPPAVAIAIQQCRSCSYRLGPIGRRNPR